MSERRLPVPIGEVFGRLTVIGPAPPTEDNHHRSQWFCECECDGNIKGYDPRNLKVGNSRSCGCLQRELASVANRTHGMAHKHPLYAMWVSMRGRCNSPTNGSYHHYGGRGITVDTRWDDFERFIADVGDKPSPQHSLDRIDNDGPYSPENCKWATATEQVLNRRPFRGIRDRYRIALESIIVLDPEAPAAALAREALLPTATQGERDADFSDGLEARCD